MKNTDSATAICTEICRLREAIEQLTQRLETVALNPFTSSPADYAAVKQIQKTVAFHFEKPVSSILSKGPRSKVQSLCWPRQVAMYFCRQFTTLSLQEIAILFGKRDHGTVFHAVRLVSGVPDRKTREQL